MVLKQSPFSPRKFPESTLTKESNLRKRPRPKKPSQQRRPSRTTHQPACSQTLPCGPQRVLNSQRQRLRQARASQRKRECFIGPLDDDNKVKEIFEMGANKFG